MLNTDTVAQELASISTLLQATTHGCVSSGAKTLLAQWDTEYAGGKTSRRLDGILYRTLGKYIHACGPHRALNT